jgi:hypothetical protein
VTAPTPAPFDTLLVPQVPVEQPRPRGRRGRQRDTAQAPPADPTVPAMPRDTIRIGAPPPLR